MPMPRVDSSADVRTMAKQFVNADRVKQDELFAKQGHALKAKMAAYKDITSQFHKFKDAIKPLDRRGELQSYKVTPSEKGIADITANGKANPGQYQMHVQQLAASDQWALHFASDEDTLPATGVLHLKVGGQTLAIDLAKLGKDAKLADLRNAINNASANPGVRASLMRTGKGVDLLVSSEKTGKANTIAMSFGAPLDDDGKPVAKWNGAGSELAKAVTSKRHLSKAQDALVFLGNDQSIPITSPSNTLDKAVDGLTINLKKAQAKPSDFLSFNVGRDMETTKKQLQGFVDGYNGLMNKIKEYTTAEDGKMPKLPGDSTLRMFQSQSKNLFQTEHLNKLGIGVDKTGKLTLDSKKLDSYLAENPNGLNQILGGRKGAMSKLDQLVDAYVGSSHSALGATSKSTKESMDRLHDRMDQFDKRMDNQYKRYVNQFAKMKDVMAQMKQTRSLF
ncbi:flagellar filament capping protein FliD [Gallaecimonas mangrovi]|uniref:flagellar filament capping protein FliD n=1 Tax=Gallaecimonas mangrovi TaxID=2291597 RepID=UPI000E1FBAD0|nr:flagellar filament capping protein FliD [Gallaecimonas mangrovi]